MNLPRLRVLSFSVGDDIIKMRLHADQLFAQIREAFAIPTLERIVIRIFARSFPPESIEPNTGRGRSGRHYRFTATSPLYNDLRQLNDKRIRFTVLEYAATDDAWLQDALGLDKVFEGSKSIMDDPISLFEPED